jgi:hypothetical protein
MRGDGGRKNRASRETRRVESESRWRRRVYWVWLKARSLVYDEAQMPDFVS